MEGERELYERALSWRAAEKLKEEREKNWTNIDDRHQGYQELRII